MCVDEENRVRAATAGDAGAFALLVEEHAGWLMARIAPKLGSRETAEDLLQEVFMAAFQQLATLRNPASFGAWLCSIADNHVRMWQRRRLVQLDLLKRVDTVPAPVPEERQLRSLMRAALGRLSAAQQEVIVHHYLKGYSYRQTAVLLDLKTDTVRSRLQKARSRLQKEVIAMSESSCSQTFELTAADLVGLRHLSRFRSDDPNRPILECVCLDAGGRMVACDGMRLLNWSSAGLSSLASPVILSSVDCGEVPPAQGATLVIEEEETTLKTADGARVTFPVVPGPYVQYEKAVGRSGPISAVVGSAELMGCVEAIEPYLGPRHRVEDEGWEYRPLVELRLCALEGRLTLRTSRDQGFYQIEEAAPNLSPAEPEWAYAVGCPIRLTGLDADSLRVGVNHHFLKTIVSALGEAADEIRIRFKDGLSALHFDVEDGKHSAVLMPMRMDPL